MASVTGGLNFGYQSNISKEQTFTTQNYYVDQYMVGGLPTWSYTNRDKDERWMAGHNMPAYGSLILRSRTSRSDPTKYPNPSPLTLYWGSGAHHRHHGGYQLAQGKMVINVDWENAKINFPDGANATPQPGLPWASNSKGKLMQHLVAHANDPDVMQAVADKTAWWVVDVEGNSTGDASATGSMRFNLFIVKANDGSTYLRINIEGSSIAFDSGQEQQFIQFGVLTGDHSGLDLFTAAGEHQPPAWNDAVNAQLDGSFYTTVNYPDDGYAPSEQLVQTGTYTKTTSSGWSVGGNIGADSSGSSGGGASGGSDSGGGAAGSDAAAGAVVA
jgi:hypothetical protein